MTTTTSGPLLRPLLAACFSASVYGGRVIREVVQTHVALDMINKQEGTYDPQTVADRRSQQRIVHALREAFPQVTIVGEEGELAPPAPEDVMQCDLKALDDVAFDSDNLDTQNVVLDWKDLVLWVDPLDGTKRFAAKMYDEVSVLIGISYKQRPIAGVVHLPFHGKHGITYWGGPSIGVFRSEHHENEAQTTHAKFLNQTLKSTQRDLICTVSSTNCDLVNNALAKLTTSAILTGGATGTMSLLSRGLVASSLTRRTHEMILNAIATVNITSALDGQPMTPQWFQEHVFPGRNVLAVNVAPHSIHRGKHSATAKLEVYFKDDDSKMIVFVKKTAKSELPPRPAAHWKRDIASYRTEATFYAHFAPSLYARGVSLIQPLAIFQSDAAGVCMANIIAGMASDAKHVATCSDPENFLMLLECLGTASPASSANYEAADCLGLLDTQQALVFLANLHASTWGQEGLIKSASAKLWPAACWWAFPKRGEEELAQASYIWPQMLGNWDSVFKTELCLPSVAALESLGERMIEEAAYISSCLSVDSSASLCTLVHGDFKSANLFFNFVSRKVVAFDWQWSGVGLGALDVANLLNTSVSIALLGNDENELELLQFYYDHLNERLQALGIRSDLEKSYPFDAFKRHYMLATLEYGRLLISSFWKNMSPQSCMAKARNANCGLGYRSIPHVVRMLERRPPD
ncbi:unnamed protein product [Peronospora belbahrii]|uniref:3'(2'),5'-bisphosphate nucleotidase n=1 Tax=Peronospora belbahrii TaxID=622444 RepID=A0AAU9KWT4_9STRA|nr:unnamed protein product [Peronospora belbahrii]